MRQAIGGDRESLERIVSHLTPFLEAQVRFRLGRLARNQADVEDLVAEVWIVALRKLPLLRPREGHYAPVLLRFLSTASSHLCNNFLRRSLRRRTTPLATPDSSEPGIAADQLARETRSVVARVSQAEVTEVIRDALERISQDKRQILVLRLLEHRSNGEIAELLDMIPNTVAVKYARALEELRQRLPKSVFQDVWSFRDNPAHEGG